MPREPKGFSFCRNCGHRAHSAANPLCPTNVAREAAALVLESLADEAAIDPAAFKRALARLAKRREAVPEPAPAFSPIEVCKRIAAGETAFDALVANMEKSDGT